MLGFIDDDDDDDVDGSGNSDTLSVARVGNDCKG